MTGSDLSYGLRLRPAGKIGSGQDGDVIGVPSILYDPEIYHTYSHNSPSAVEARGNEKRNLCGSLAGMWVLEEYHDQ